MIFTFYRLLTGFINSPITLPEALSVETLFIHPDSPLSLLPPAVLMVAKALLSAFFNHGTRLEQQCLTKGSESVR